jgi:hypothetical protein
MQILGTCIVLLVTNSTENDFNSSILRTVCASVSVCACVRARVECECNGQFFFVSDQEFTCICVMQDE